MQFGTPAKLGQQRGRRQSKPCLLSQRPLAAVNGEKEGKKGKYSPRVKGILHRAAVNTETPGVFHHTGWKACPEGGGSKGEKLKIRSKEAKLRISGHKGNKYLLIQDPSAAQGKLKTPPA